MLHAIVNALLGCIIFLSLHTFGALSARGARNAAGVIAWLMRHLYWSGVRLIRANLAVAFPEKSPEGREKLLRENLFYTAWAWLDFLRILRRPLAARELLEPLDIAPENMFSYPSVGCLPHINGWENFTQAFPPLLEKSAAVAEIFPYSALNNLLNRSRTAAGLKIIPRHGAARGLFRAIEEKYAIGLLIDQSLSPRHGGIFVDFFGLPATASPLPALAYKKYGMPLIACGCARMPSGKFRFFLKRLNLPSGMDKTAITQAILRENETFIRQYPAQYTWLYRRWSHIPADLPEEQSKRYPYYAVRKKYRMDANTAKRHTA